MTDLQTRVATSSVIMMTSSCFLTLPVMSSYLDLRAQTPVPLAICCARSKANLQQYVCTPNCVTKLNFLSLFCTAPYVTHGHLVGSKSRAKRFRANFRVEAKTALLKIETLHQRRGQELQTGVHIRDR